MNKARLEAFSDGVIAILITIMVLELKSPHGTDWESLRPIIPVFLTYVLSFNGKILWANMHLLFWLSLIPFVTGWMGENHFAPLPTAVYGVVVLLAAVAYYILQRLIVVQQGANSKLEAAIGKDIKGKISPLIYLAAIPLAFVNQWISAGLYVLVALMWLIPDRRIESKLNE
jgi:uncharacterized membrane protein